MNTAKKQLSDADKTAEYEIPASFKRSPATSTTAVKEPGPTPVVKLVSDADKSTEIQSLQAKGHDLKTDIRKTKSEMVRKEDEKTVAFNLRQLELQKKVSELESKKAETEKEIHHLIQQKNTKIHDDLRKVLQVLMNETKKFGIQEKVFEQEITKIATFKSDIQSYLEDAISQQKKTYDLYQSQTQNTDLKEKALITEMNSILSLKDDIQNFLSSQSGEFQNIAIAFKDSTEKVLNDMGHISTSMGQLVKVKMELSEKEHELNLITSLKNQTQSQLLALTDEVGKLEVSAMEWQEKIETLKAHAQEYTKTYSEVAELEEKKNQLNSQLQNSQRLEMGLALLEDKHKMKQSILESIEAELIESKKRHEILMLQEVELMKSCTHYQLVLNQTQSEILSLEKAKVMTQTLQNESLASFQEKKLHYQQETLNIENEYEKKKLNWEQEFNTFTHAKQQEALAIREAWEKKIVENWDLKQSELIHQIQKIVYEQTDFNTFTTREQKSEAARKEIEVVLSNFFGNRKMPWSWKGHWKWISLLGNVLLFAGIMWKVWH